MKPSTKAALKSRVREFENLTRSLNHRNASTQERVEHKNAYLEDLLRLYQGEVETLIAERERADLAAEVDLTREIDKLTDTNYHLSQKVKALHEEITTLRSEKELALTDVTHGFQRQLQRNNERMKINSVSLQQENEVLKAKVEQLEAFVREKRALAAAEEEVRVVELQYHVDDLRRELKERTVEMETERRERTALEDELASQRQQLHDMVTFIDTLGDTAGRVRELRSRVGEHHGQVVEMLLHSSQVLLREHIEASERAEMEQARAGLQPTDPPDAAGAAGGHLPRGGRSTASRRSVATDASAPAEDPSAVSATLREATRLLTERREAAHDVAHLRSGLVDSDEDDSERQQQSTGAGGRGTGGGGGAGRRGPEHCRH
jgi:hypothetical protein